MKTAQLAFDFDHGKVVIRRNAWDPDTWHVMTPSRFTLDEAPLWFESLAQAEAWSLEHGYSVVE